MRLHLLKWAGGVLAAVLLSVAALLAVGSWNWLREPVAQVVMAQTGRRLAIDGDLRIAVSWPALHIDAADVVLGNPEWAASPIMLRAGRVGFALDLPALLRWRVAIDDIVVADADLRLEVGPAGQNNWQFAGGGQGSVMLPDRLAISRSRLSYDDHGQGTAIIAGIETDAMGNLEVDAAGKYRAQPLKLQVVGGTLVSLRDESRPYPFRIAGSYGRTTLRATGSVTGVALLSALDARLDLRGANLADLYPLLGIALLETGPYRFAGRVSKAGDHWQFTEIDAQAGASDFTGMLRVDGRSKPLAISGDIVFGKLDFADLAPAIGKREAPAASKSPRLLPDRPFRSDRWGTLNADLRLRAGRIIGKGQLPLDDFTVRLRLAESVVTLDPLQFGIADGQLAGTVRLDGRQAPLRAEIDLQARRIVFAKLFPGVENKRAEIGRLSGSLKLAGSGDTLGQMLASGDGRGGFVVAQGEISRLMMEVAGLHVLEAIIVALAGDRPIAIRCGVAAFAVRAGMLRSERLELDTQVTKILGGGSIDFAREQIDLTLRPQAKGPRMISLRSPIRVHGPFTAARVEIDKRALLARSAGALALGAVNPLLALVPLVEAGRDGEGDCSPQPGAGRP